MKMKKILFGFLAINFVSSAFADLTGKVVDAASNTPFAGVLVGVHGVEVQYTTDENGGFSLSEDFVGQNIKFAMSGYTPTIMNESDIKSDTPIVLKPSLKSALQKNYDAVRGNEQSLANRTLGAAAMATVGAGGQMTASSLSEQKSDADAERDMAAYLATFRCDWGSGRNVRGGETNVELPGAGQLIPMYSEYVTLANDLKLRKAQLGLKAGIESEPILDSATTGLYDDVSTGISSGAYASLARALQNPNGADAKMWAEQKEKTAENLKTGIGLVATGVAASVAGNAIINRDAPRDRSREIIAEFESLKMLASAMEQLPELQATDCPPEAIAGTPPNCNCGKEAFYIEKDNRCESCPAGQVVTYKDNESKCGCPEQTPLWDSVKGQCVERSKTCEKSCDKPHMGLTGQCTCECKYNFKYNPESETCECEGEDRTVKGGKCYLVKNKTTTISNNTIFSVTKIVYNTESKINLNTANMFKFDSADIVPEAETKLKEFVAKFNTEYDAKKCTEVQISIVGYTDPTGSDTYNRDLSAQRANKIKDFLKTKLGNSVEIQANGKGEDDCTCGVGNGTEFRETGECQEMNDDVYLPDNVKYPPCRRAEVTITGNCTTTTTETETETQTDIQITE